MECGCILSAAVSQPGLVCSVQYHVTLQPVTWQRSWSLVCLNNIPEKTMRAQNLIYKPPVGLPNLRIHVNLLNSVWAFSRCFGWVNRLLGSVQGLFYTSKGFVLFKKFSHDLVLRILINSYWEQCDRKSGSGRRNPATFFWSGSGQMLTGFGLVQGKKFKFGCRIFVDLISCNTLYVILIL